MANIALCWELGAGLGHLLPLAEFARYFNQRGHSSTLFSRYPDSYRSLPGLDECAVVQAPYQHSRQKQLDAYNYSGLMRLCGYQNEHELAPLLKSWLRLFEDNNIQLVVADHSPTAVLAAHVLQIPCIMTGNGFSVPPQQSPCPNLRPWETISESFLAASDKKLCETINRTLSQIGYANKRLNNLTDLLMRCDQLVATHPLIDHYRDRPSAIYINVEKPKSIAEPPVWPEGVGEPIFVYFNAFSQSLVPLINQLLAVGRPTLAVVPKTPREWAKKLAGSNINLTQELVDIDQVAAQCNTIISHGGQQGTYDFLCHGIPSIMLPDVLERTLFAFRVGQAQLGFAGTPDPRLIDLPQMLATAANNSTVWQRAKQFQAIAHQGYSELPALLDDKLQALKLN